MVKNNNNNKRISIFKKINKLIDVYILAWVVRGVEWRKRRDNGERPKKIGDVEMKLDYSFCIRTIFDVCVRAFSKLQNKQYIYIYIYNSSPVRFSF